MAQVKDGKFDIVIEPELEGERIDAFIASYIEGMTRSFIQKLIKDESITVAGRSGITKNYRLKSGDIIHVTVPEAEDSEVMPEPIPLNIVYEDDDVLVVDKEKGMVVHPAPGNKSGTLVNAIMYHCDSLSGINGVIRPGIVHRIDKDTGGLLVVAKNDNAHLGLAKQFEAHSITREYRAVVYNNIKEDRGRIDEPIGRDPKNRLRMAVTNLEHGRRAVTNFQVIERSGKFTYVACRLETGRTHQIRVHMAHIKHPLLGDCVYGPKKGMPGIDSQVLHAVLLGFNHPATGKYMEFKSSLSDSFIFAMRKAGLSVSSSDFPCR